MATGRENLFDAVLVKDLMNKVKGKSSLAVLSGQTPIPFNGLKEFIFSMDNEIDIVAENGKKSEGGITVDPVKSCQSNLSTEREFQTNFCTRQKKNSLIF